jgi:hypothetical protein
LGSRLTHLLPKFEPDKFVDGLLGIGAAGGKSSASEGAKLATRLETLRKERSTRAPDIKKVQKREHVAVGAPSPQAADVPQKKNRRKKKKKKGKQ